MTPSPESVFATICERPGSAWLDGHRGWSVLAWDPVESVTDAADWPDSGRRLAGRARDGRVPFDGGCLGYVGYDAGHAVEAVPTRGPTPEPPCWLQRYEGALCFRHADRRWFAVGTASARAAGRRLLALAPVLPPPAPAALGPARSDDPRDWQDAVRRILAWIAAGDCYQVNLSRAVHHRGPVAPWPLYRRLSGQSAAEYGAYLRIDEAVAVLSNSPELLLAKDGSHLVSRPIKGTRPRGSDRQADAALREALAHSEKDRAELAMIVDLVRNDLGRIAVPGTVRTRGRTLTAHANVWHAETEVHARLAPHRDAWDALAACFPPGSVTGAPKVRACQRIHALESAPRGVYCGSVGFVADNGRAVWSVAIRTGVASADGLRYHVGGGIVADSDPEAEWQETVDKGRAWAQAVAGPLPEPGEPPRPADHPPP